MLAAYKIITYLQLLVLTFHMFTLFFWMVTLILSCYMNRYEEIICSCNRRQQAWPGIVQKGGLQGLYLIIILLRHLCFLHMKQILYALLPIHIEGINRGTLTHCTQNKLCLHVGGLNLTQTWKLYTNLNTTNQKF